MIDDVQALDLNRRETQYPIWGISAVMVLLFLSPFVSSLLPYIAFVICLYRVVKYDARVFATDYCVLIPVSVLFRTSGGMSLLVYLCLLADVWYLLRNGIRANSGFVILILLLNYLMARMQWDLGNFMLCFGQLFLLCVLLPRQDAHSAERTVKLFCLSLIISSLYALLLRNTRQLESVLGHETPAYWGSSAMRFKGLFTDPNYYSYNLIVALALLMKLKDCGRIRLLTFLIAGACLTGFGILTYSQTFFLALILLVAIFIVWQFWNKRYIRGMLLALVCVLAATVLLFAENSPFSVVLTRLSSASDLSDLTTGRSDIFSEYLGAIMENPLSLLFGAGLAAPNLGRDPHNLFLEIAYYTGVTGLILLICYFGMILYEAREKVPGGQKQNFIAKYEVLLMILVIHCTLHGMFAVPTYAMFFLSILSTMLTKKKEAN